VPGPKVELARTLQSLKAGQMWSSAVTEYKQRMEPSSEHLEPGTGKAARLATGEMDPMFSSFAKDGLFREPFVAATVPFAPLSPQLVRDYPPRRNSVYGAPVSEGGAAAGGAAGGAAARGGFGGGSGGGGIDGSIVSAAAARPPHLHATRALARPASQPRLSSTLTGLASTVADGAVRTRGIF